MTRGAVGAGVALTGVFSTIAAHAFPGRSGQRATAVSPPAGAVAPPAATTTTEPPTTMPPTTAAPHVAGVVHRPLQAPVTAPRAVVPTRPPATAAPVVAPVHRVRPHVVSGGS
jgi:hypothetical protein